MWVALRPQSALLVARLNMIRQRKKMGDCLFSRSRAFYDFSLRNFGRAGRWVSLALGAGRPFNVIYGGALPSPKGPIKSSPRLSVTLPHSDCLEPGGAVASNRAFNSPAFLPPVRHFFYITCRSTFLRVFGATDSAPSETRPATSRQGKRWNLCVSSGGGQQFRRA